MKFILINVQDTKKDYELKKYKIDKTHDINEILLKKDKLIKFIKIKNNLFNNIKLKHYTRHLKKYIYKALNISKGSNEKWYYILGADIIGKVDLAKYIIDKLDGIGGKKYIPLNEMDNNITNYIYDYVDEQKLIEHEMKVLFVYKDIRNINFDTIERCIKKYKKVNIYLLEKPNSLILDKISKINKEEGSGIEIIKYNKKAFMEYNVIYFADDLRTNYPRMRINKTSLVVDEQDSKCDKYNSNVKFFNNIQENIEDVSILKEQYGILDIAAAIRKIVN